jgi:predicted alpha/beta hydrolase
VTATDPHRAVVDGIALTSYPARTPGAAPATPASADPPAPADAAASADKTDGATTGGVSGPAVAIVWPAMGTPARFYRRFAEELQAAGLTAVVADLRGTGESGPAPTRASRWAYGQLAADVGTVLAAVRRSYPGGKAILVGHSLGGQAALLHLAAAPGAPVDGLVLVAVGLPYWRAYRRGGAAVLAYTQGINAVSTVLRVWPGWTFGGRQARGVIGDWAASARTGRYRLDVEAALPTVKTPVLAISFDGDRFTPHGTLDHLLAKVPAAPVTRERLRLPVVDGRPVHFAWVRESGPVAARIASFVAALPAEPSR